MPGPMPASPGMSPGSDGGSSSHRWKVDQLPALCESPLEASPGGTDVMTTLRSDASPPNMRRQRSKLATLTREFTQEVLVTPAPYEQLSKISDHELLVVKEQEELMGMARARTQVAGVLHSQHFHFAMGMVILANTISIGFEQTSRIKGDSLHAYDILEMCFLIVYTCEIGMHFFAFGCKCLRDHWVKFDLVMVVIGWGTGVLLTGLKDQLNFVLVLRTARPLRLARAVRLLARFRDLWMLVRGLLNSASTMFYTLFLLIIVLFVFSSIAFELITENPLAAGPDVDEEFHAIVQSHFRSLPVIMMTLVQFVTMDNIVLVYKHLVEKDWVLGIYFMFAILVISIVLMNLVTAVVVNSAMEQANQDRDAMRIVEKQRQTKLLKELKRLFQRLDDDGSGSVTLEEVAHIKLEDRELLQSIVGISDPIEVFQALDFNGDGSLSIDEFCEGIINVTVSKVPVEIKRTEKKVDMLRDEMRRTPTSCLNDDLLAIVRKAVRAELQAFGFSDLDGTGGTGDSAASSSVRVIRQPPEPAEAKIEPKASADKPSHEKQWTAIASGYAEDKIVWPKLDERGPPVEKFVSAPWSAPSTDRHPAERSTARSSASTACGIDSLSSRSAPVHELLLCLEAAFARQSAEITALRSCAEGPGHLISHTWRELGDSKGPTSSRPDSKRSIPGCSIWAASVGCGEGNLCEQSASTRGAFDRPGPHAERLTCRKL